MHPDILGEFDVNANEPVAQSHLARRTVLSILGVAGFGLGFGHDAVYAAEGNQGKALLEIEPIKEEVALAVDLETKTSIPRVMGINFRLTESTALKFQGQAEWDSRFYVNQANQIFLSDGSEIFPVDVNSWHEDPDTSVTSVEFEIPDMIQSNTNYVLVLTTVNENDSPESNDISLVPAEGKISLVSLGSGAVSAAAKFPSTSSHAQAWSGEVGFTWSAEEGDLPLNMRLPLMLTLISTGLHPIPVGVELVVQLDSRLTSSLTISEIGGTNVKYREKVLGDGAVREARWKTIEEIAPGEYLSLDLHAPRKFLGTPVTEVLPPTAWTTSKASSQHQVINGAESAGS